MKLLMENWKKFLKEEITTEEEAAQWIANELAPLIAAADAGNFTEPLAALVARLNTAEGLSPLVRDLLGSGEEDGVPTDEAITVNAGVNIPAPKLVPTQGVIDLFKSVGFNGSNAGSLRKVIDGVSGAPPILVAGSGDTFYIIDGHHRWSGATVFNVNCEIPANVIVMDPGKALLVSQLAIAAYVGAKKMPSATADPGRTIIGPGAMSSEAVYKTLKKNVGKVIDENAGGAFWNPEVVQVVIETGYGSTAIAQGPEQPEEQEIQEAAQMQVALSSEGGLKQVASNCGALANKYSAEGPPREIMPQFDPKKGGPKFKSVAGAFTGGEINYQPAFAKAAEE